ncbi:MAG TPA: hypothetical protein VEL76_11675 [Gemmataceae bacterium]|nr:hypothetical protein [Gemmataceae bacterium]
MTTTFREFLREQVEKHQAEGQSAKATVDEWRSAVERLFAQLREWLREDDPTGVIEIEEEQKDVTEPSLGRYRIPRLSLRAFGKWIGIIPKARKTVATASPPQKSAPQRADGRVDITDELRRYVLYRFRDDGRDVWLIDDLKSEAKPLDKDAFERVLMSYLR